MTQNFVVLNCLKVLFSFYKIIMLEVIFQHDHKNDNIYFPTFYAIELFVFFYTCLKTDINCSMISYDNFDLLLSQNLCCNLSFFIAQIDTFICFFIFLLKAKYFLTIWIQWDLQRKVGSWKVPIFYVFLQSCYFVLGYGK